MHPMLITQVAQQETAERIRAAERERLASGARGKRGPGAIGRVSQAARGLMAAMAGWRMRTQLGALERPSVDPFADTRAS